MARNKYPEETRRLIVETAAKLFIEQGYDQTSIQDIIDHLGGLSKGAIYYHFKSKAEIMNEVSNMLYAPLEMRQLSVEGRTDLTGKEKIRELFRISMYSAEQKDMFSTAPDLMKNPKLLVLYLKEAIQNEASQFVQKLLEEGIADGSVQTEYPKELAEVMMLLGNVWINPMVYQDSAEEMARKMEFFQYLMEKLGLDIIEDDMMKRLEEFSNIYRKSRDTSMEEEVKQ